MSFWKHVTAENTILLFCFFLPLNEKISTLLLLFTICLISIQYFTGAIAPKRNMQLYLLPLIYLLYVVSILFFSGDHRFKWFEQRASFLAFPLIFYTIRRVNLHQTLKYFVYGCTAAYIFCLAKALYTSFHFVDASIVFDPLIDNSRGFFEAILYEGNFFFGEHFSVLLQTSYFGFYLTLALCILILYNRLLFGPKRFVIFFVLLAAGIFQTMSIAAFVGVFIALFILGLFLIKKTKLKLVASALLLAALVSGYFFQPRFNRLVTDLVTDQLELDPNGRYGVMLRLLSWDAAFDIIKENYLFGVGLPDAQKELISKYKEKGYVFPLKRKLNSHNQFLQITLECGLLGLILVVAMFYLLIRKSSRVTFREKILIIVFTVLLFYNFIFESYFNRYVGLSFVSFFYCLLISLEEQKKVYGVRS